MTMRWRNHEHQRDNEAFPHLLYALLFPSHLLDPVISHDTWTRNEKLKSFISYDCLSRLGPPLRHFGSSFFVSADTRIFHPLASNEADRFYAKHYFIRPFAHQKSRSLVVDSCWTRACFCSAYCPWNYYGRSTPSDFSRPGHKSDSNFRYWVSLLSKDELKILLLWRLYPESYYFPSLVEWNSRILMAIIWELSWLSRKTLKFLLTSKLFAY